MGGSTSKACFETVFTDQDVDFEATICLKCRVKTEGNQERIRSIWKKNDETLRCVEGKHTVTVTDNMYTLEIKNAQLSDDGKYTLTLEFGKRFGEHTSCSAVVNVAMQRPWREVKWDSSQDTREQMAIIDKLQKFKITNDTVKELHFLVCGRIGSGKSSTINTIRSIFERRQFVNCLAGVANKSQTVYYVKETIKTATGTVLPFAFFDMMGMERVQGVCNEDIISCLKGHVKEGYEFNHSKLLPEKKEYYNAEPSLSDEIHCLLYVVAADTVSMMQHDFINKMKSVREEASRLKIPQVVFLTKVDETCTLTLDNLQNVYKSKKIKDKMKECSTALGVPMNCIFPIQNYHEQTNVNNHINCLMLDALSHIVQFANDYVEKCKERKNELTHSKGLMVMPKYD